MQEGAIPQGANVIVVDDLIATGRQFILQCDLPWLTNIRYCRRIGICGGRARQETGWFRVRISLHHRISFPQRNGKVECARICHARHRRLDEGKFQFGRAIKFSVEIGSVPNMFDHSHQPEGR